MGDTILYVRNKSKGGSDVTDVLGIYRKRDYPINENIKVHHNTLDEIVSYGEQRYYKLLNEICSTPADQKVRIWDAMQKYWDEIDEYELFLATFMSIKDEDLTVFFPGLDTSSFKEQFNPNTGEFVIRNVRGVVIDRAVHALITDHLRFLHSLTKNTDVGYDKYTKDIMIEDDRDELVAASRKPYKSHLWPIISSMTNCVEFKYRYDDVWELPIGVFMDAVKRVQKQKDYNHIVQGIYSGTVDSKKVKKKELEWMGEL